jgi:F0F1-type ATP synthase assembly protein I
MYDDWQPERPSEEFGDALVIGGVFGLVIGVVAHNPFIGVVCGLILGVICDGVRVAREMRLAEVERGR